MGNSNGMMSGSSRINGNRFPGGMQTQRTAMLQQTMAGKSNNMMKKGENTIRIRLSNIIENQKKKTEFSQNFVKDLIPKTSLY